MQISGCCRKNESSADVPPFCVPPITKSTRIFQPQIDTDFHRFCNSRPPRSLSVMSSGVETSRNVADLNNGQTISRDSSTSLGMTKIAAWLAFAAPTKNLTGVRCNIDFVHPTVNIWIARREKNEPVIPMIKSFANRAIVLISEIAPARPSMYSHGRHVLLVLSHITRCNTNGLLARNVISCEEGRCQ